MRQGHQTGIEIYKKLVKLWKINIMVRIENAEGKKMKIGTEISLLIIVTKVKCKEVLSVQFQCAAAKVVNFCCAAASGICTSGLELSA